MADEEITVARNDETSQYEVFVDGAIAGFTRFRVRDEHTLVFPHTVVDPAFGGRGLGSVLVGRAMADVAARGETVVPLCPFVTKYLRGHEVQGLQIAWPGDDE